MTETDEKLIATAAIIGDKSIPKTGYITPAAIGITWEKTFGNTRDYHRIAETSVMVGVRF